jgi:hypothetical protein
VCILNVERARVLLLLEVDHPGSEAHVGVLVPLKRGAQERLKFRLGKRILERITQPERRGGGSAKQQSPVAVEVGGSAARNHEVEDRFGKPAWVMIALGSSLEDAFCSTSKTRCPRAASRLAAARPTGPPPTTAASGSDAGLIRPA